MFEMRADMEMEENMSSEVHLSCLEIKDLPIDVIIYC